MAATVLLKPKAFTGEGRSADELGAMFEYAGFCAGVPNPSLANPTYVFFNIGLSSRRVVHFGVTLAPTGVISIAH